MEKSIKHFQDITLKVFEKAQAEFYKDPKKFAEFAEAIHDGLDGLARIFIKETLEELDQLIQKSQARKKSWYVEKHSQKQLITSFGAVTFKKTLFRNKKNDTMLYLLDKMLNLEKHERITEDALVNILKETAHTSYERGGQQTSKLDKVTKQTVKNVIHNLDFPKEERALETKKKVENLYIDADEDHISLQYRDRKGDLITNSMNRKNNTMFVKLIYVYEGIENETSKSKRRKLVNPHYFCRVCSEEENTKLWDEVYEYMDGIYDLNYVKNIFLNGDGGGWIKAFKYHVPGVTYILDEYHLYKYIRTILSFAYDSASEIKRCLFDAIRKNKKNDFNNTIEILRRNAETNKNVVLLDQAETFFMNNWQAARNRIILHNEVVGCSAEGHVSHVLSSRMSSRPLGWSKRGAANIALMRQYVYNNNKIIDLVRYQKNKKSLCQDNIYFTGADIIDFKPEENDYKKYFDVYNYSISFKTRKAMAVEKYCVGWI